MNNLQPAHLIESKFQEKRKLSELNNSQEIDAEEVTSIDHIEGTGDEPPGIIGIGLPRRESANGGLAARTVGVMLEQLKEQMGTSIHLC